MKKRYMVIFNKAFEKRKVRKFKSRCEAIDFAQSIAHDYINVELYEFADSNNVSPERWVYICFFV